MGVNSIYCESCKMWCHKKCSGLRTLNGVQGYRCPRCVQGRPPDDDDSLEVSDMTIKEVEEFCYLGDVIDAEAGAERAVRARTAAAWKKWREMSSLLTNGGIPLKCRAQVYEMCVRSVLLYGAETWPLTQKLTEQIRGCDRRMMRFMAQVKLKDRIRSEEVERRCGLPEVSLRLRQKRLRWFGHVKRATTGSIIGEVCQLSVDGRRPTGRPRKTWYGCVREDLAKGNIEEDTALDREKWRRVIAKSSDPEPGK